MGRFCLDKRFCSLSFLSLAVGIAVFTCKGAPSAPDIVSTDAKHVAPDIAVQLMSPDALGEINFDKEVFFRWSGQMVDRLREFQPNDRIDHDVGVLAIFHPAGNLTLDIRAKPSLSEDSLKKLTAQLTALKSPQALVTDFHILFFRCVESCKLESLSGELNFQISPKPLPGATRDCVKRRRALKLKRLPLGFLERGFQRVGLGVEG